MFVLCPSCSPIADDSFEAVFTLTDGKGLLVARILMATKVCSNSHCNLGPEISVFLKWWTRAVAIFIVSAVSLASLLTQA